MKSGSTGAWGAGSLAAVCAAAAMWLPAQAAAGTLIVGARLIDGSGAPARAASVRIEGDRIVAVGRLEPLASDQIFEADGLVLAPGFIDAHSHHDRGDFAEPAMTPLLAQGVTTIVVGQDGYGSAPIAEMAAGFAAHPASVNLAAYTGHGHLRDQALGADYRRKATAAETALMQGLLQADMAAGSLGLSTGLEYDPGIYSSRDEVLALARTAAAGGGRYISHMRNEDVQFDAALDELLDIGRATGMPVQISHLKLGVVDRWGHAPKVLARLDAARAEGIKVTADVYPYEYWQSTLTVLLPERDFTDLTAARFALTRLTTPQGMLIAGFKPDPALVGSTIAEIAARRGEEPAATYLSLIRQAEAWRLAHPEDDQVESVIGTAMAPGAWRRGRFHRLGAQRHLFGRHAAWATSARRGRLRQGAEALCARAASPDARGRRPQDDRPDRRSAGSVPARPDPGRLSGRSCTVRSGQDHRPVDHRTPRGGRRGGAGRLGQRRAGLRPGQGDADLFRALPQAEGRR